MCGKNDWQERGRKRALLYPRRHLFDGVASYESDSDMKILFLMAGNRQGRQAVVLIVSALITLPF